MDEEGFRRRQHALKLEPKAMVNRISRQSARFDPPPITQYDPSSALNPFRPIIYPSDLYALSASNLVQLETEEGPHAFDTAFYRSGLPAVWPLVSHQTSLNGWRQHCGPKPARGSP